MIFLLMVLVIMVFAVLWNVDLHKILHLKSRVQNAGDSAALMAARWQGITLNVIGDLNIMQAVAISDDDAFALSAITNIQARLCYVGPMIGLEASQQAAKNNGMYRNEDFDTLMTRHATAVRDDYPHQTDSSGEMLFPEPYEGCWAEYSAMLQTVANNGVAAGPDNASFYSDGIGGHTLLDTSFYDAVAGQYWCWFYHGNYALLEDYTSFRSWPPLPPIGNRVYMNSEIYGLSLETQETSLSSLASDPDSFFVFLNEISDERGTGYISTNSMATNASWYCYNSDSWDSWTVMNTEAPDYFPLTGSLKEQYNYMGCDTVCRVAAPGMTLLTPDQDAPTVKWSAAAKPFGSLNDNERPNAYSLVLPAFYQVAMIPVDASSLSGGGSYNIEWREHIEGHLPTYLSGGPLRLEPGCYYCNQLTRLRWESSAFRRAGRDWLSDYSYKCIIPPSPGGSHRTGGSRRGH